MAFKIVQQIAHYRIEDVIGDGGMGTVYRGVDTRFGRTVAIKLLHPHLARDPEVVRRFRTEAVIGAKLSHPHVVRVYDFLEGDGVVGFVMEQVEGPSLERLLGERGGRLQADEVERLFRQVVSGVAHAHGAGLVHRDLKPSNVLVETVDGEWVAKVTDFGVAKVVGGETHLTGLGAKIGTLAYMSPEQIEAPGSVDARTDVYALGVLGYELLTGQVPFDGGTEFEVMRRILAGERRPLARGGPLLPGSLAAAIDRCLSTGRTERYGDARELLRELSNRRPPSPGPGIQPNGRDDPWSTVAPRWAGSWPSLARSDGDGVEAMGGSDFRSRAAALPADGRSGMATPGPTGSQPVRGSLARPRVAPSPGGSLPEPRQAIPASPQETRHHVYGDDWILARGPRAVGDRGGPERPSSWRGRLGATFLVAAIVSMVLVVVAFSADAKIDGQEAAVAGGGITLGLWAILFRPRPREGQHEGQS